MFSTHLHPANSYLFYLTWPWPSRLCVLCLFGIMWCYLEKDLSSSIILSPCEDESFVFSTESTALGTTVLSVYLLKERIFICQMFWGHPVLIHFLRFTLRWQRSSVCRESPWALWQNWMPTSWSFIGTFCMTSLKSYHSSLHVMWNPRVLRDSSSILFLMAFHILTLLVSSII